MEAWEREMGGEVRGQSSGIRALNLRWSGWAAGTFTCAKISHQPPKGLVLTTKN